MDSRDLDATFHNYVEYWWLYLDSLIEECRRAHRRPVLIALSRKMPRFIDWFREYYAPVFLPEANIDFFESLELTTEIAIPFIFSSRDCSDCDFIIIDDLIIRGTTLAMTSNLLYALTGRIPRVSCIAMREDVKVRPKVILEDFEHIPVIQQDRLDKFADQVSAIVETSELPVDMEFPVFTISTGFTVEAPEEVFRDVYWWVKDFFKERCYYVGNRHNRFSVDLSISLTAGNNTDFSKVRFFLGDNNGLTFEVFSPMILPERLLTSDGYSPFSNSLKSNDPTGRVERLWRATTEKIHHNLLFVVNPENLSVTPSVLRQEIVRSLAVWANYIFSLMTFIRNRVTLIPEEYIDSVKLSVRDLSLLLGRNMAASVEGYIQDMIDEGVYVLSVREKDEDVPWNLCPPAMEEMMEANKITSLLGGGSPEGVAERIFRFMHYTNPNLRRWSERSSEWRKNTFGETYFSLQDALYPVYANKEYWKDLRSWVDSQIDAGRIVPKYNDVETTGDEVYWRRFFHAGVRRFADN